MFLRSGARPRPNFNSRIQIQIRLSLSPPHAPHQKPKKPVRVPFLRLCLRSLSLSTGRIRASWSVLSPVANPSSVCTRDVPHVHPRLARFPISSRPAPIPSPDPQSPSPEPLSSPHPISPPSPTLHTSAHTVGRERVVACGAGSLTQIQSILGTETTTVTDGTSIQVAALWSGQVGSCRVDLGHPLSISAAQFRARVSALPCFVLLCSALS